MVRKRFDTARDVIVETVRQRCFWLFVALLLLLISVPFIEDTPNGKVTLSICTLLVLMTGAAAVGRGGGSTVISTLLALPTAGFLTIALIYGESQFLLFSELFGAAFFFIVTVYLLTYVFRRDVLTMDKLYGAAAAFLLMGVLWTYFYWILLVLYPGALTLNGQPITTAPAPSTMLYFSYVTLTATGMSDILPVHPVARMVTMLEMISGVLFMAVLIARLAGTYTPPAR